MTRATEHFITLFDSAFLPIGLALYRSLEQHADAFHLWVLAMDESAERTLNQLDLPSLSVIPLREVEAAAPRLAKVKPQRSHAEYCWTLSSFTFDVVFAREPAAQRVTYIDADVYFFRDPRLLLDELDASGKNILITEHAYDPEYDQSATSGRFCVQFLTMDRSPQAEQTRRWWQDRCIESCSADSADGQFGDQKYLDQWPQRFGDAVHVLERSDRTLAPWNALHVARRTGGKLDPVMYHFHGFRIIKPRRACLYTGYAVGPAARRFYDAYVNAVRASIHELRENNATVKPLPPSRYAWDWLYRLNWAIRGMYRTARID